MFTPTNKNNYKMDTQKFTVEELALLKKALRFRMNREDDDTMYSDLSDLYWKTTRKELHLRKES